MKNVLLIIHDDVGQEARLQCALDLTRALGGHLTCVGLMVMPHWMGDFMSTGGQGLAIATEEAAARRHREAIEERLAKEDVPWNWAGGIEKSVKVMSQAISLNDVVVVSTHLDRFPSRELAHLAGDLLVEAGKPLLAVPQHARRFAVTGHAMVAWDGSREAETAMRAAIPLLTLAERVTLLEVDDGSIRLPAEEAAEYLSRHQIKPLVLRKSVGVSIASSIIIDELRAREGDWLVMGGFGHARLVEATWGGVTRRLFRYATVPLLLAH